MTIDRLLEDISAQLSGIGVVFINFEGSNMTSFGVSAGIGGGGIIGISTLGEEVEGSKGDGEPVSAQFNAPFE